MENSTPIILVRQLHKAKRAGDHYDLRVVIDDKAYSWATKKEMPELGKPHVIFEQPVHDKTYALSKKVVIPAGQYGAGVTTLDFAQKGKARVNPDEYHLDLNNGERFLMKRLNPEKYGEKSWLFARKRTYKEKEELALKKNKYLEKAAALGDKDLNRSVEEINEVYRRKGLPEVTAEGLGGDFKQGRPVVGRVAGTLLGGVVPIAGNIAGYYIGKSTDNSSAGQALTNKYLLKAASDKKKKSEGYSGWGRAGMVVGLPMAAQVATMPAAMALGKHALNRPAPDISEADVASYVKAKKLRHVTRDHSPSPMGAHFMPATGKDIGVQKGLRGRSKYARPTVTAEDPALAMHEYGHAHSLRKGQKHIIRKQKMPALMGSNMVMRGGHAAMLGTYMGTSDNEKVRKAAPYATAALASPMLYEEAAASLSPYKHLHKTRGKAVANQFLKKMLPAYGTYATMAAGSIGSAVAAKKFTENKIAKNRAAKKD